MLMALVALLAAAPLAAQTETTTVTDDARNLISFGGGGDAGRFGDYVIDIDLFAANPPQMPKYDFSVGAMLKDYNKLFSLNSDVVYSKMTVAPPLFAYSSLDPSDPAASMNSVSYRLKSGGWFSTFGNYDANGRRNTPGAAPWESQDFRAGFELKSANGNFKFRVDYQWQKNNGLLHNGGQLYW
jgi:hypothetical protein